MLAPHAPRFARANSQRGGVARREWARPGRFVVMQSKSEPSVGSGSPSLVAPSMAINPPPPREDKEAFTVNLFRNYELRTAFAPTERRRLPTTLVTGWLGSGKTTVMRHVLSNSRGLKIACAVNDFAELNIDAELVARASKQQNFQSDNNDNGIVELTNGCLCCTLGGELETQVWRMLDAAGKAGVRDESSGVDSQRHVEYLLIETSGLVDPTETVAALDKTFGKMARVRLDSVVCVVDAESASLGGGAGMNDSGGGIYDSGGAVTPTGDKNDVSKTSKHDAWAKQLAAADVVLLNKIDLLVDGEGEGSDTSSKIEKLAAARAFVKKYAPDARVVECVRGKVPLPSILDVQLLSEPEGKFGHDWDSASKPFLLSSTGGGLRKDVGVAVSTVTGVASAKTVTAQNKSGPFKIDPIDPSRRTKHFGSGLKSSGPGDDFGSVSFACGAVSLASFQRWVKSGIPRNAVRAKGFVTFIEDPLVTHDFHLSGKRRVEIEPSVDGVGTFRKPKPKSKRNDENDDETPQTRLVLIGPGMDQVLALGALELMRSGMLGVLGELRGGTAMDELTVNSQPMDDQTRARKIAARLAKARNLIESDKRLELVEARFLEKSFTPQVRTECVYFRLTGAFSNGTTSEIMEKEHGVDFNKVNHELVTAINSSGNGATATIAVCGDWPTHFGSPTIVVRVAVGSEDGEGGVLDAWGEVGKHATVVLQRHIGHIPKCRCGF